METIRIIFSLALQHGWSLSQLDVKNAFLHGELKEEVYMEQPPGYAEQDSSKWICRLNRSLYGLKQASRSWFESFSTEIKQHGFNRSILNHSIFIFKNSSITTWVLIYVDDIIITWDVIISNLYQARHCILSKPSLSVYACTHRYSYGSCKAYLRYLKGTLNDGLVYSKDDQYFDGHELITYTDADWAGDPDERKSVSGYCVFIGQNAVVWSSKKQKAIARSTAEAEYRAMAAGVADVTWVRHLLEELNEPISSSILFCDNQSAINIARNPILHCRTKHIEIDQHFVRQKVENREIEPAYVSSDSQIADMFTKGLTAGQF
ncbi:unnamed protein product [Victoria cruziana]